MPPERSSPSIIVKNPNGFCEVHTVGPLVEAAQNLGGLVTQIDGKPVVTRMSGKEKPIKK